MSSYSIEMNDTNLDLVPNNRRTSDTELGTWNIINRKWTGERSGASSWIQDTASHGPWSCDPSNGGTIGVRHTSRLLDRVSDFKDPIWIWIMSPHF